MGQLSGVTCICSSFSISSSRSNGSWPGRSSLLINTITGVLRIRHTCISLRVCDSHAFRRVNDDDYAVAGRQHAECVFGEILVTGGVKNVDLHVLVLETHDGGGHGDTSLSLDFHEVGGGRFLDLV